MHLIPFQERHAQILEILRVSPGLSAATIQKQLPSAVSLLTVKRDMAVLVKNALVTSTGRGRTAGYVVTRRGEFFAPIDAHAYCLLDPDRRHAFEQYDDHLIASIPRSVFSRDELKTFDAATEQFRTRSRELSETLAQKELERFVIELSWKSSQIEGNTYTLLDTERLIRNGIEAAGRSRDEAVMIINHKKAFEFVYENRWEFAGEPSRAAVEEIHRLLTDGLHVRPGVRHGVVGIIGTRYRPLDTQFQIQEAMITLRHSIGRADDPYTAALMALLGISYIQPFEDGNKRTARLLANAVLLSRGCAPLSYRSADEVAYREATLVFYETHSLLPFKDIFATQYLFSAAQYGLR